MSRVSTGNLFTLRWLDANADPGVGFTYQIFKAGTTTKVSLTTDKEGLIAANTANRTADADGYFQELYFTPQAVKLTIYDSSGAIVKTIDNLYARVAEDEFETGSDLANVSVDTDRVSLIRIVEDGFLGKYSATQPFHSGFRQDAAGSYFELIPQNGAVYYRQFKTLGTTAQTDAQALQNAINFVQHHTGKGRAANCKLVLDPEDTIDVGTTVIHWAYGDGGTTSIHVEGYARPYREEDSFSGVVIKSSVAFGPANIANGLRHSVFENIHFKGLAFDSIGAIDHTIPSFRDKATWTTALTSVNIVAGERYAPHAGFAIDAYSGTRPTGGTGIDPLPVPDLPSYITAGDSGYGRTTSSSVKFINCGFSGFEVGVVVSPSVDAQQGDYVEMIDRCFIERCDVAFSCCGTQNRSQYLDLALTNCRVGVTTNTHGAQSGRLADTVRLNGGIVVNLIDLGATSTVGPVNFEGEMENIDRIGDIDPGGSTARAISFNDFKFNFRHANQYDVPPNILNANNTTAPIEFNRCEFINFREAFSFYRVRHAQLNNCIAVPTAPSTADTSVGRAERAFNNGTAGGAVLELSPPGYQGHSITFTSYNIDTGATGETQTTGQNYDQTGRSFCIPIPSRDWQHSGYSVGDADGKTRRPNYNNFASNTTLMASPTVNTDGTITATRTGLTTSFAKQVAGQLGDFLKSSQDGTVLMFEAVSGTSVTYRLMTNKVSTDGGTTWSIRDDTFAVDSGTCEQASVNKFALSQPIWGNTTVGSPDITGLRTANADPETLIQELSVGDALQGLPVANIPTNNSSSLVISNLDTSSTPSIDLTGNATSTMVDQRFDIWARELV